MQGRLIWKSAKTGPVSAASLIVRRAFCEVFCSPLTTLHHDCCRHSNSRSSASSCLCVGQTAQNGRCNPQFSHSKGTIAHIHQVDVTFPAALRRDVEFRASRDACNAGSDSSSQLRRGVMRTGPVFADGGSPWNICCVRVRDHSLRNPMYGARVSLNEATTRMMLLRVSLTSSGTH